MKLLILLIIINLIILILLFLPIFLKFYLFYNVKNNKLYFAIYLFNFIKITAGYIKKRKLGGVYLHFKRKAIIIDEYFISKHKGERFSKGTINLDNLSVYFDMGIGNANALFSVFSLVNLINTISKPINLSKNADIKAYLNVYDINFNFISVYSSFTIHFNLFCILKDLFANFINKGVKNAKFKNA